MTRLQKIVYRIAEDEVSSEYMTRLSMIERGLSAGKGVKFKNKKEIRKFFKSLQRTGLCWPLSHHAYSYLSMDI